MSRRACYPRPDFRRRLLTATQDDVAAIARAVGYESQSRFTAAFKETYGALPTEYRKHRALK